MVRASGWVCLLLVLISLIGSASAKASAPLSAPLPIAQGLVGRPAVAGAVVAWFAPVEGLDRLAVKVHDVGTGVTRVVAETAVGARGLATDGAALAWVEPGPARDERVQRVELATGRITTLLERNAVPAFGEIAIAGDTLVYVDATAGHQGLFARSLRAGDERLVSPRGQRPVVAGGQIVWAEARSRAAPLPPEWALQLVPLDGIAPSRAIARADGGFAGYALDGATVVWSAAPPAPDRRVFAYALADGTTRPISSGGGLTPALHGLEVAWIDEAAERGRWTLRDSSGAVPATSDGPAVLWGSAADGALAVTVEGASTAERRLYVVRPGSRGLTLSAAPPALSAQGVCPGVAPCGQVRAAGYALVDDAGRWPVHGVQFFLPQYGINSWSFHDARYAAASADVDRWLNVAHDGLAARTLRIFVELPSGGIAPTSAATIFDFAERAAERGMRLGIVVQNSPDFAMTPERRAWLTALVDYFAARDATSRIAYISAANEINNWCSRADCFDRGAAYVDAAIAWVAEVAALVRPRGILLTVGISTEVADTDGLPAWYDFHRPDARGRRLADLVDFLAPHNYGGGAYGVIGDLRYALGYAGPIVLEEYGFPSDPLPVDPRYTEGAPACRDAPLSAACANTAPYYVEISLRAIRETTYAGGVAWMLADVAAKRCGADPYDLWTGLVATGAGYCGGTAAASGQPKATGYRVWLHHTTWPAPHRTVWLPLVGS